jgi:hypothetical protein
LAAKVSDPRVRLAIEAHATLGSFYQGTAEVITNELVRSSVDPARIGVERDHIILDAAKCYLLTVHPVLVQTIWEDIVRGLVRADNAKIAQAPICENWYGALDKANRPEAWMQLEVLPSLGTAEAKTTLDAAARDPYVNLWHDIPLVVLAGCTILAGGAASVISRKAPRMVLVGWFALATGILVFITCMLGVFYLDRYALPLLITIVFGLLASLASLLQCTRPTGSAQVPEIAGHLRPPEPEVSRDPRS